MARAQSPIPTLLCVDVEPDARHPDPRAPAPWHGYERAHQYLSELRPVLQERTGSPVRYCWFLRMDPQIAEVYGTTAWVAERYRGLLDEALRHGDEVGLHLHLHRWRPSEHDWLLDLTDQPWIDHCVLSALDAFVHAFGRPCTAVRLGNWINQRTVALLDRSGVRFDLTLTPGQRPVRRFDAGGRSVGWLPSFLGVPRDPYHPSRANFRRPDPASHREITMIPLSVVSLTRRREVRNLARCLISFLGSGLRRWEHPVPLSLAQTWRAPDTFPSLLRSVLSSSGRPYLASVLRSDFASRPALLATVREAVRCLLDDPAHPRLVFTTPEHVVPLLASPLP